MKIFSLQLLLVISLFSPTLLFSQEKNRVLDPQNMRPGEQVEYCGTHKKLAESLKDPEFAKQYQKEQAAFESLMLQNSGQNDQTKSTIYTIPVVFHVLHNGGSENISREQILRAVAILNRDFAMQNEDTALIQTAFQSLKGKANIRFVLATKSPNGTCFSGITRTKSIYTNLGDGGGEQVDAIVAGNDVYNGEWPGNKYLNIFVCKDIGGAAGYTRYPSSWSANSMQNGIWVLQQYVGDMGTADTYRSRTLTHEVGHWLNLAHVWGSTNNPGISCGDDNVDDTPTAIGSSSCFIGANTCDSDNAYWGFNQIDNIENYMEYAYCSKMFTIGQVDRMRTALIQTNTGRGNLVTASNLASVGVDVPLVLCGAKFSASRTVFCAGETIEFTDESYNNVTGWNWEFVGGSPAVSTDQNPSVIYSTPGVYPVKLVATDGSTALTENKVSYITVLPAASGLPYYENFEELSSLNSSDWFVESSAGPLWSLYSNAGSSGTKSATIQNFGSVAGEKDYLVSKSFDLSDITTSTGVTLTFKAAYRRIDNTSSEYLRLQTSSDCGETWGTRRTLSSFAMTQGSVATSSWVPSTSDWVTYHVTNIVNSNWVENFRFRFEFSNGNGNNVYLDDINLYAGSPSSTPVLTIDENKVLNSFSLFPNPVANDLQISFESSALQQLELVIRDVSGKKLSQQEIFAADGHNVVIFDTQGLAHGTYFVELNGTGSFVSKFVKH